MNGRRILCVLATLAVTVPLAGNRGCVPVEPAAPVTCEWEGAVWQPGDSFPAGDGCNTCTCGEGGAVLCTKRACISAAFTGASHTFGECWGPCRYELTIADGALALVVSNWDGTVYRDLTGERAGRFTDAGAARAMELAVALLGVELPETYGCPDCADGGNCAVSLLRDGVASEHHYDCAGGPPPALEEADAFFDAVIDTLTACADSEWVELPVDIECAPLW